MFIEERHTKIHERVRQKGRIEVSELSALFQVSEDTIRRDLKILEEKGLIKRTHGGAILSEKVGNLLPYPERVELETERKEALARKAVSFVEDGDTLFLCGATTVSRMVPMLSRFHNLIVVTNSVMIAAECVKLGNGIKVYMIGGPLHLSSASATGTETVEAIRQFSVDKVFMSVCSASVADGLSTPSFEEAPVFRAILGIGRETFLLYGGEKHGTRALAFIGPVLPEYRIIVDAESTSQMREEFSALEKKGLRIE
ncbi:MAG TPA: DeoR/GlpR family DNA-binding transcription regulator [Spirochaetota bacterium]